MREQAVGVWLLLNEVRMNSNFLVHTKFSMSWERSTDEKSIFNCFRQFWNW